MQTKFKTKALLSGMFLTCLMGSQSLIAAENDSIIRVALNADIRSTEPGTNRDENSDAVVMHIVEGLVGYREDASVAPLLASKVDISPDGLTYTFTLRPNVQFHNGATLTSADVKWSWQRYLNPKTQWRCLPEFDGRGSSRITSIETPDGSTVVFKLDKPNGLFLATMARPDCGGSGIMHSDSVAADGSWIAPDGTGPFKLGDWKRGQYVELNRFANYSAPDKGGVDGYTGNKTAYVDKVRFVVIPDAASAKAALMSGNIDLISDVTPTDAAELEKDKQLKLSVSQNLAISGLLFQTQDPLLKDVRIRRAIAMSLDYAQMVAAISNGRSTPNNSAVPQTSSYYDAVTKQGYEYNLTKAQALLKEAGYRGQPIKMIVNKRYPQMFDMGVLSQAMAQAAGINLQMETLEWGTQLERYQTGNYQMMSFSYSSRFDPAQAFDSLMGDKSKEPRKVWDNPEAQEILNQASIESDPAKRKVAFDKLHKMMINDVPMVIIYNGTTIGAYSKRLEGYKSWPVAKPRLWGVHISNQ